MEPSAIDIAWLTGVFEGEGYLCINRFGALELGVNMTDRDVIERLDAVFPCKKIRVKSPAKPGYKTQYCWVLHKQETVEQVVQLMLPLLGERRRAKALEVLAHIEQRPGAGTWNRKKTHCPQGHEYTIENTRVYHGRRHCRRCDNGARKRGK